MPNIEWEIPFVMNTGQGELHFNACEGVYTTIGAGTGSTGFQYKPLHGDCYMTPGASQGLRIAKEAIPQADGTLIHRRFKWGYEIQFKLAFWKNDEIAKGEDLVTMWDHLILHLNSIMNDDGRVRWLPSGRTDINANYRMVDDVRVLQWPVPQWDGINFQTTFQLESPFPYGLDYMEITTNLLDSVPQTLNQPGNTDMYPVFKVYGPTSLFVLENATTGVQITYNDSLPGAVAIGGGDYVEIDTFRNTAYLNGSGANLKAGIDVLVSDFWPLIPFDNDVQVAGADADVLWQAAWA